MIDLERTQIILEGYKGDFAPARHQAQIAFNSFDFEQKLNCSLNLDKVMFSQFCGFMRTWSMTVRAQFALDQMSLMAFGSSTTAREIILLYVGRAIKEAVSLISRLISEGVNDHKPKAELALLKIKSISLNERGKSIHEHSNVYEVVVMFKYSVGVEYFSFMRTNLKWLRNEQLKSVTGD